MSFMQRGLALTTLCMCVYLARVSVLMCIFVSMCVCEAQVHRICIYACERASPLSIPAVPKGPVLSVGVSSRA